MSRTKRKRTPKTVLRLPDLEQSKSAVPNSLASQSSRRSYDHAIREFIDWYCSEPRLAFNKTVFTATASLLSRRTTLLRLSTSGSPPLPQGRLEGPKRCFGPRQQSVDPPSLIRAQRCIDKESMTLLRAAIRRGDRGGITRRPAKRRAPACGLPDARLRTTGSGPQRPRPTVPSGTAPGDSGRRSRRRRTSIGAATGETRLPDGHTPSSPGSNARPRRRDQNPPRAYGDTRERLAPSGGGAGWTFPA